MARAVATHERILHSFSCFQSLIQHATSELWPPSSGSEGACASAFSREISQQPMQLKREGKHSVGQSGRSRGREEGKKEETQNSCFSNSPAAGQTVAEVASTALALGTTHDATGLLVAPARGFMEAPGLDVLVSALDGGAGGIEPVLGDIKEWGHLPEASVAPVQEVEAHTLGVEEEGGRHWEETSTAPGGKLLGVVPDIAQDGELVGRNEVVRRPEILESTGVCLRLRARRGKRRISMK